MIEFLILDDHSFFTEVALPPPQQKKKKPHRRPFKKAAIGIYFIHILQHRAAKHRLVSTEKKQ